MMRLHNRLVDSHDFNYSEDQSGLSMFKHVALQRDVSMLCNVTILSYEQLILTEWDSSRYPISSAYLPTNQIQAIKRVLPLSVQL